MKKIFLGLVFALFAFQVNASGYLQVNAAAYPTLNTITGLSLDPDVGASVHEEFLLTDTSGVDDDATAFLLFEFADNANSNSFGIYEIGFDVGDIDAGKNKSLEIFDGSVSPGFGTDVTLRWDTSTNDVTANGVTANIEDSRFGFWLNNGTTTFYSEASKNNDEVMMLTYLVGGMDGLAGANIILGWEDFANADNDFNDMVVGVTDVAPVPLPAAVWLFGSALMGLVGVSRRKSTALSA